MGFQVKFTTSTKIKIDKAIEQDTADSIEAVGPGIKAAFEQYEHGLLSDFAKAAFVISPANVDEAKVVMESAGRVVSSFPEDEQLVEGVAEMQTKTRQYNRPSAWASGKIAFAPHEWHAAWSTGPTRRVGMVVLSKATGAGEPERNWGDVKQG